MSGKHRHGRRHKAAGVGPTLSRKERVARLQEAAPDGKVAINSHGEAILVTARETGEEIVSGTGGLTQRQLHESENHGIGVMRRREIKEREKRRTTMGEFLRGRKV